MSVPREAEAPEIRLRRRAMDLLARREHTYYELSQKLAQRFPEEAHDLIEGVLDRLREENLQSDERFLESYLNTRLRAGKGPLKIRAELSQKGIGSSQAEAAINSYPVEIWHELAEEALQRRFPVPPDSAGDRQKAWRFLQQRGFDTDTIQKTLNKSAKNSSWSASED